MKNFFILLLFFSFNSFAQIFRIDSLPKQGILLDKNWKWHAGDNPDFVKADFDDSAWESIDPTSDIYDLKQVQKATISWFRISMQIDTSLFGKSIGLRIQQMGASEIYLNGELVFKLGKVSSNLSELETYNPSGDIIAPTKIIYTKFKQSKNQIWAIRYALQPNILYTKFFARPNLCLQIELSEANHADANPLRQPFSFNITSLDYFKVGIFLMICGLHFVFFLLYPKRKNNLFISLYAFLAALFYLSHTLTYQYVHDVGLRMKLFVLFDLNFMFQNGFILTSVYLLFKQSRGIIYYIAILYSIVGIPLMILDYNWGPIYVYVVSNILIYLEICRIAWLAKKQKKDGALIILFGGIGFLLFYIFGAADAYFFSKSALWVILEHITINLALLSLPTAISLFLSREFAINSRSLERQLVEIEILSEQNLKQEKEKQQILSTQNETLEKQVTERTTELQHSLDKLKATQAQLIQSEKLASLGELTAGIAHEIQNPLNFVNNFSELSVDLAKELQEEVEKSPLTPDGGIIITKKDKEYISEILTDLSENQEKINHHGKRASSIVKGMLEHSRASTGVKELTNINVLADKYLRLAYHGLRAKDSNGSTLQFNSDFKTDFDESLPKIAVIPQDFGRVLLNLFNNAFYAVAVLDVPHFQGVGHLGKVIVSTQQTAGQIIIKIIDNGTGMSEATKAKIFQPFFTTKPTGQGTGLGLSLAYDIITKGHGGTIECETIEGKGTTFIVKLPLDLDNKI